MLSAKSGDELRQLIPAHSLSSGQGDELLGLIDDDSSLDAGSRHVDTTSTPKFEDPFIAKLPQCPQDGVPAHLQNGRQIHRRWQTVARTALSGDDGPT